MNYFDRPELSHSKLKRIDLGYKNYLKDFETSSAMLQGTKLHEYILEGKEFKESKFKTFCNSLKDNEVPLNYLDKFKSLKDAVESHPANWVLDGKIETELYGEREGLAIKGKVDIIGENYITDFKTTKSISNFIKNGEFNQYKVFDYSYHTQLEWYKYLAEQNNHKVDKVYLFVLTVDEEEVFCLDLTSMLDVAESLNEQRLSKLKTCMDSAEWSENFMFNEIIEI